MKFFGAILYFGIGLIIVGAMFKILHYAGSLEITSLAVLFILGGALGMIVARRRAK